MFNEQVVNSKFPVRYRMPVQNSLNTECHYYINLIKEIMVSVDDLLDHIDGKTPRCIEVEHLWHKI